MLNIGSLYENKVIQDEVFPIHMFQNQLSKKGRYFTNHWHEHIEFHYVLKGEGTMICNHNKYKVYPGNLAIFNSNELHEGFSDSIDFHALVLIFDLADLAIDLNDWHIIFQSLIHRDDTVERIFLEIFQEEQEQHIGYKIAMKGKIYELLTYLMRNYVVERLTIKENSKRNKNLNRLNHVLTYIHDNYKETIVLSQLAELCNLSEYRFSHLFKETVGQSPTNYLISFRLKKAYKLLQNGEMTIAEVSHAVGFNDFNNFGRLFRNHYGVSPSKVINK